MWVYFEVKKSFCRKFLTDSWRKLIYFCFPRESVRNLRMNTDGIHFFASVGNLSGVPHNFPKKSNFWFSWEIHQEFLDNFWQIFFSRKYCKQSTCFLVVLACDETLCSCYFWISYAILNLFVKGHLEFGSLDGYINLYVW